MLRTPGGNRLAKYAGYAFVAALPASGFYFYKRHEALRNNMLDSIFYPLPHYTSRAERAARVKEYFNLYVFDTLPDYNMYPSPSPETLESFKKIPRALAEQLEQKRKEKEEAEASSSSENQSSEREGEEGEQLATAETKADDAGDNNAEDVSRETADQTEPSSDEAKTLNKQDQPHASGTSTSSDHPAAKPAIKDIKHADSTKSGDGATMKSDSAKEQTSMSHDKNMQPGTITLKAAEKVAKISRDDAAVEAGSDDTEKKKTAGQMLSKDAAKPKTDAKSSSSQSAISNDEQSTKTGSSGDKLKSSSSKSTIDSGISTAGSKSISSLPSQPTDKNDAGTKSSDTSSSSSKASSDSGKADSDDKNADASASGKKPHSATSSASTGDKKKTSSPPSANSTTTEAEEKAASKNAGDRKSAVAASPDKSSLKSTAAVKISGGDENKTDIKSNQLAAGAKASKKSDADAAGASTGGTADEKQTVKSQPSSDSGRRLPSASHPNPSQPSGDGKSSKTSSASGGGSGGTSSDESGVADVIVGGDDSTDSGGNNSKFDTSDKDNTPSANDRKQSASQKQFVSSAAGQKK